MGRLSSYFKGTSCWLYFVIHFGTENWEEQLKIILQETAQLAQVKFVSCCCSMFFVCCLFVRSSRLKEVEKQISWHKSLLVIRCLLPVLNDDKARTDEFTMKFSMI